MHGEHLKTNRDYHLEMQLDKDICFVQSKFNKVQISARYSTLKNGFIVRHHIQQVQVLKLAQE